MIKRLRKRFIRIATLAVTGVMLVLCIALNTANFLSVRAEQQRMLRGVFFHCERTHACDQGESRRLYRRLHG